MRTNWLPKQFRVLIFQKSQFENVEKYLVAVLQKNFESENFEELRYEHW